MMYSIQKHISKSLFFFFLILHSSIAKYFNTYQFIIKLHVCYSNVLYYYILYVYEKINRSHENDLNPFIWYSQANALGAFTWGKMVMG